MHSIRNVETGIYGIDPLALSTSGVSSCIAVVIELKESVFLYHADTTNFNASLGCSIDDAFTFLTDIYNKLHQLDANSIVENIYFIGGWNNMNYSTLRSQINLICDQCTTKMKQNNALASNNFDVFVSKITLNLIGFNLPQKNFDGTDKEDDGDDNPYDYIFDCTLVYDRSLTSSFVIYQFAGREEEMVDIRNDSMLKAVYIFDNKLKHFQGYLLKCKNNFGSSYYDDFVKQVSLNVYDPTCVTHFIHDTNLKKTIYDLLGRVEAAKSSDEH